MSSSSTSTSSDTPVPIVSEKVSVSVRLIPMRPDTIGPVAAVSVSDPIRNPPALMVIGTEMMELSRYGRNVYPAVSGIYHLRLSSAALPPSFTEQ